MVQLIKRRLLTLTEGSSVHRPTHLSAASGLVQHGDWLYVVADDEQHLGIFPANNNDAGTLVRLFPGELPELHEARKASKPDLEVLTYIPISPAYPAGALLGLGSGSKDSRRQGVIIAFDKNGKITADVRVIDLSRVYKELKKAIGKLNIEGAVIIRDNIVLFQRGNKKNNINCTLTFPLADFYQATCDDVNLDIKCVITHYDLGDIDGIPLCFTDASALPNGDIVFTAAAENTADAYLDGVCTGSAIGVINAAGKLLNLTIINEPVKLEGIAAQIVANRLQLLLVTDADDVTIPAQLYTVVLDDYAVLT